jgi:hypothetical protein
MIPFVLIAIMDVVGCLLGAALGLIGMFEPIWRKAFSPLNLLLSFVGLVANVLLLGFDLAFVGLLVMLSSIRG